MPGRKKKLDLKILVSKTIYDKKKTKSKPYLITHINKDGTTTKYGVNKQGHRYKTKIKVIKNQKDLEKEFNQAKKEKNFKKNNVTFKMIEYSLPKKGKYRRCSTF
jgi:hypothetical protein